MFTVTQMVFSGHLFTNEGLKPYSDKVKAIMEMERPKDVDQIWTLQGTVNYLAKFLPRLSTAMAPLLELTHKGVVWNWSEGHKKAFATVKQIATTAPVLAYYDPDDDLVLQCDASQKVLGAALLQKGKPVAYASKALTETKQHYAQIEKETLAIVFGLEKLYQMTFVRKNYST